MPSPWRQDEVEYVSWRKPILSSRLHPQAWRTATLATIAAIVIPCRSLHLVQKPRFHHATSSGARPSPALTMAVKYDVSSIRAPDRWKDDPGDIKPGFGGLWPGDPDAEKHHVKWVNKEGETVASADVPVDRYLYYATEEAGADVPIINKKRMCRQGCCTTCAVKVLEGEAKAEGALGLLKDLRREGYVLTCCAYPRSDLVLELQDEDEVYKRQFGDGFEGGGVEWGGFLPEDD